ncbi:MAG: hypothetical protein KAR64_06220, partial [Thermoplasmatales archaeon]|nr:hypothetical protein [Thermoplasmatales archaeon]
SISIFCILGLLNLFVQVREKAPYYAPPYGQGRAVFREYCRKMGFGVDGGLEVGYGNCMVTDLRLQVGGINGLEVGW